MIITGIFRLAQILFAVVVIALSAVLINGYGPGHNPSIIDYGAFCGGAGLVFAIVGIAAMFFDGLSGLIVLCLDGIATFFLLAGGIAMAVIIKTGSCTDGVYLYYHQGTFEPSSQKLYGDDTGTKWEEDFANDTIGRCREVQATTAFVWFLASVFMVTLALGFKQRTTKHGGNIV